MRSVTCVCVCACAPRIDGVSGGSVTELSKHFPLSRCSAAALSVAGPPPAHPSELLLSAKHDVRIACGRHQFCCILSSDFCILPADNVTAPASPPFLLVCLFFTVFPSFLCHPLGPALCRSAFSHSSFFLHLQSDSFVWYVHPRSKRAISAYCWSLASRGFHGSEICHCVTNAIECDLLRC